MSKTLLNLCFLGLVTVACSSTGSRYSPDEGRGGYQVREVTPVLKAAIFTGNQYMKSGEAMFYSQLRAIEYCMENEGSITRIHSVKDLSRSQTVQRSSTSTYQSPQSVTGSADTFNLGGGFSTTNMNGQTSGGAAYGTTTTWNETYTTPIYATVFQCTNRVVFAGVGLRDISAEDMKPYVKDLMGAVQIAGLAKGYPAERKLKVGDLVTKIEGDRIKDELSFSSKLAEATKLPTRTSVSLTVIREGKTLNIDVGVKEGTDDVIASNAAFLKRACALPHINQRPVCLGMRTPASR